MDRRRGVLSAVAVIILIAVLAAIVMIDKRQSAEKARTIARISALKNEEELKIQEAKKQIYLRMIDSAEKAISGIVCWGDGSAVGNQRGNLVRSLDKLINDSIFGEIRNSFISTSIAKNINTMKVAVVNMGVVNEDLPTIMARTGAHRMVLDESIVIPAGIDAVDIVLVDDEGNPIRLADQPVGVKTILGVEGELYTRGDYYDSVHPKLCFMRNHIGEGVEAPKGTPMTTGGAEMYVSYCPILFFSEYEEMSPYAFSENMKEIVERYGGGENYVLICTTAEGGEWDVVLSGIFGERYIRNDKQISEMKGSDYDALAESAFDLLDREGVFAAVREAVGQAQAELQKLQEESSETE